MRSHLKKTPYDYLCSLDQQTKRALTLCKRPSIPSQDMQAVIVEIRDLLYGLEKELGLRNQEVT